MDSDPTELDAEQTLTRAELIRRAAVVGAVVSLPAFGTASVGEAFAAPRAVTAATQLTPAQLAVLGALVERIFPSDSSGPGAKEAGAATYIENSLGGGLAGGLSAASSLYESNLPAVDAYASSTQGAGFASLAPDKQDAVLADIASGKATGFTPDAATFFAALREHTVQGMFSDPIYGGNKGFVGWDILGYPGVKMPVPASDQAVGPKVKAAHKSTYANGQFAKARREAIA